MSRRCSSANDCFGTNFAEEDHIFFSIQASDTEAAPAGHGDERDFG